MNPRDVLAADGCGVEVGTGEEQARMMVSMIAEPDDAITGRILHRITEFGTLRLFEDEQAAVPEMNCAEIITIWRT